MIAIAVITIIVFFIAVGVFACRYDLQQLRRQVQARTVAELDQEYMVNGVVTHIPTDAELEELSDANWHRIPASQRELCKAHLRNEVPAAAWGQWKREGFPQGFHFYGGMAVRNCLRDVLSDEELPRDKNWDDYYMGCLREILREM